MLCESRREHVLILAPTGRDAPMIGRVLARASLQTQVCSDINELCLQLDSGAGVLIIAEEALTSDSLACLEQSLARQPVWSDVPLVILTGGGKTTRYTMKVAAALQTRGNATLLERPLRILTLVSVVRSALRARSRQYDVRHLIEQTQQAVQQRDQFLAMLGHELRNPLAAIRTAIAVIQEAGGSDPEMLQEQHHIIQRQSSNVCHLVDDLLDVARITSGKIVLERRHVDLREIAERSLAALRLATGTQRHQIATNVSASPIIVFADEVRMEQVIMNLLTNAVKYTPQGGKIWLSVGIEGSDAVVRVEDDGAGIEAAMLRQIFEPFVQSHQPLARSVGGLGIGLTVVRTLVQLHGGTIDVRSDGPGKGSEFTVRVPLVATEARSSPARADSSAAGETQRRVLIIEDNADARTAMHRLLRIWDHEVDTANTGREGIQRAVASRPEIILIDIGLPDIDGYEVASALRTALDGGVLLAALTGYGQPEDRQRAQAAGFDVHLVKPVEPDELRKLLRSALPSASRPDAEALYHSDRTADPRAPRRDKPAR